MHLLLNIAAFKVGWISSVMGGAMQLPWIGPVAVLLAVALHLNFARRPRSELLLIVSCGLIGASFDSLLVAAGWVSYSSGVFFEYAAPYWIIAMWMLFATTLNVSMQWMRYRPVMTAVIGFVAGPMSYIAGEKLGAINFVNETAALVGLAVGWAIMLPLLTRLASRLDGVGEVPSAAAMAEER